MQYGMDYLGGAQFASTILQKHPPGWAARFFSNTFGDALPVAEALASRSICPKVGFHLMWDPSHMYGEKDIPALVHEAQRVLPLILRHPNIEWSISPFCEHSLPFSSMRKVFDAIVPVFTNKVTYVNSPSPKGAVEVTCVNDFHGISVTGSTPLMSFSFDGNSCVDADVESLKARWWRAKIFYFWHSRFNGKAFDKEQAAINQRHEWPSGQLIDSIAYLANPRGEVLLPPHWTLKTHAEDKGTSDWRANKPVFLAPTNAPFLEIKSRDGHVIDHISRYPSPYIDGRSRYYSTNWGYQTAQKAVNVQGDAVTEVWVGGHNIGTCNMAFRQGDFPA